MSTNQIKGSIKNLGELGPNDKPKLKKTIIITNKYLKSFISKCLIIMKNNKDANPKLLENSLMFFGKNIHVGQQ